MSKLKVLVAVLAVVALLVLPTVVFATVPRMPAVFAGTAYLDDVAVAAGTIVSAWIDGVNMAETATGADGFYYLRVDGKHDGETVLFKVAGYAAYPTAIVREGRTLYPFDLRAVTQPLEEVVTFPDPNLEAAIREALGIGPDVDIYRSDLETLTTLHASGRGIVDLTGIEYCINLTGLGLGGNEIRDLSPLANLTKLTWLCLVLNQISDISYLANLTSLTELALSRNEIRDLSPLSGLINLTRLLLDRNQISDLSPLASLTKLTWLELNGNQISDIGALSGLTELRSLCLENNQVANITPLSGLIKLGEEPRWWLEREGVSIYLNLRNNQITDISPLVENEGLSDGDGIDLRGNPLSKASLTTYIPQLQGRGVAVLYDLPIPGDVNRDGRVDGADLALVAAAFNSRADMPNWNPAADLNHDGIVDIFDLVLVGRNFGKSGSPQD